MKFRQVKTIQTIKNIAYMCESLNWQYFLVKIIIFQPQQDIWAKVEQNDCSHIDILFCVLSRFFILQFFFLALILMFIQVTLQFYKMQSKSNLFLDNILLNQGLTNLSRFRSMCNKNHSFTYQQIQSNPNLIRSQIKGQNLFNKISEHKKSQINLDTIWKCILKEFKWQIFVCYLLKQMEYLARVALCYFISQIFDSFQQNQKQKCYLYAGIVGIVWILLAIFNQCSMRQVQRNSLQIKGSITYAMYLKILSISNFSINGNQSGQIINSIIEFHDILQNQSIHIFACLSAPICIIGLAILLVYQIGWLSLAGIGFYLLCQFIHYHYAQYNAEYCNDISKLKDQRIQILTQVISAFRYIKMQVWQQLFMTKISSIRQQQMISFIKYSVGKSLQKSLNQGITAPTILLIVGLTARIDDMLTSKQILEAVLNIFLITTLVIYSSYGINCYYRVNTLLQRVASIFSKQNKKNGQIKNEQDKKKTQQIDQKNRVIICNELSCSYNEDLDSHYILKDITLQIKQGQFIGVFGKVGQGKSTFLNTLANQMLFTKGKIVIEKDIAFQQSQPALFIGSIKQNILFGKKFNSSLYKKAIKYSCLDSDLQLFTCGDQTMIQEGAVNLSGGQRVRLCLARVIYADKPIILLDDPLSSLDLKVIQKIMSYIVKLNKAEGKTIILVTHQIHCLLKCDRCLQITQKSVKQLTSQEFCKIKQSFWNLQEEKYQIDYDKQLKNLAFAIIQMFTLDYNEQGQLNQQGKQIESLQKNQMQGLQIQETGFIVSLFTYAFKNKANYFVFPLTLFLYGTCQACYYVFVFYLNKFDEVKAGRNPHFQSQGSFWMFLGIMAGCVFIVNNIRSFLLNLTIQLSNKALHNQALSHVFHGDILELDKLGTKGILDKFSTDLGLLDVGVSPHLHCLIVVIFIFTIQLVIIAVVNPIIIPFVFAIMIPNYLWYNYSVKPISVLRQMDLRQKGSVISLFSQTLNGLIQIDNMQAKDHMLCKLKVALNKSINFGLYYRNIFRAYAAYLNYYTTLMIIGSYFSIIAMNDTSNYTNFTFAAVFLVETNDWIVWAFENTTSINSTLVSANRLASLSDIKTQLPLQSKKQQPQKIIKSEVRLCADHSENELTDKLQYSIDLRNISLRYGSDQNLALNNISIPIQVGKKIALIGRTGSGKSSIIQILYRLVQALPESIYLIDGQNALKMDIQTLRKKFTCIPQIPFLFSGTIRSNLDPFQKFKDQQLQTALKKVCIHQFIEKLQSGIDTSLASGEVNFSAGQKQLLCLARAILQNKNFLILDEATSSIDQKTDEVIQTVLRKQFVGKTIISVAHRLQTILDFDQIIILSKGQIVELGTANELWQNKKEFYQIIHESGYQKFKLIKQLEKKLT